MQKFCLLLSYPAQSSLELLQDFTQAGHSCDLCRRHLCWSELSFCSFPIRKETSLNNVQRNTVKQKKGINIK